MNPCEIFYNFFDSKKLFKQFDNNNISVNNSLENRVLDQAKYIYIYISFHILKNKQTYYPFVI